MTAVDITGIPYVNESRHMRECGMSHVNDSCRVDRDWSRHYWFTLYERGMSHAWISHVPYEEVMLYIPWLKSIRLVYLMRNRYVAYMNESCPICTRHVTYTVTEVDMSHDWHTLHEREICRIHEFIMSHMNQSCHMHRDSSRHD